MVRSILERRVWATLTIVGAAAALALTPSAACAQEAAQEDPPAVTLWPDGAPGARTDGGEPKIRVESSGERVRSNIHVPTLTPYLPSPQTATGCAVIIAPGGGHRELWADHEGHYLGRWLQERGIAGFVLLYRLANEEGSTYTVDEHALADIQRAIRTVRARSGEWKIDPQRVGVIGFSAGGELAGLSAMRNDAGNAEAADLIDREGCRPDFQALIYPGRLNRLTVSDQSPPVFLAGGYGDRPDISQGMAELYLKYKAAGVPAELHIYSNAGHGFGLRPDAQGAVAKWPERFAEWLADREMLKKSSTP